MSTAVIFFSWTIVVVALFVYLGKPIWQRRPKIPRVEPSAGTETNDRLIVVKHAGSNDVIAVVKGFAGVYDDDISLAAIKLAQLSEEAFAVTFPYGISFKLFCDAVNYFEVALDDIPGIVVNGWTTATPREAKLSQTQMPQALMVYIPQFDHGSDMVHLVSKENIGYRYEFSSSNKKCVVLSAPEKDYMFPPNISLSENIVVA